MKPFFVRDLVPVGLTSVNAAVQRVAMVCKDDRKIILTLCALRYIYIPLTHPAADFFVMASHMKVCDRVLGNAQVTARVCHPAAYAEQEVIPDRALRVFSERSRSSRCGTLRYRG